MSKEKYTQGLDMEQFDHIPQISVYNNNYYKGFDADLLFGKSDDDATTEWYLVENNDFKYLGESYVFDETLYLFEKSQT